MVSRNRSDCVSSTAGRRNCGSTRRQETRSFDDEGVVFTATHGGRPSRNGKSDGAVDGESEIRGSILPLTVGSDRVGDGASGGRHGTSSSNGD